MWLTSEVGSDESESRKQASDQTVHATGLLPRGGLIIWSQPPQAENLQWEAEDHLFAPPWTKLWLLEEDRQAFLSLTNVLPAIKLLRSDLEDHLLLSLTSLLANTFVALFPVRSDRVATKTLFAITDAGLQAASAIRETSLP